MEEKEDKNKSEERQQSKRFTKIKLPYLISDLEPEISSLTMFYHYDILHSAYEQGLNNLVDDFEKKNGKFPFEDLVSLLKKIKYVCSPIVLGLTALGQNHYYRADALL